MKVCQSHHLDVMPMKVNERSFKMELNSKEDLYSALDEIMARLSVIEQSTNEKTKDEMPKDDDNQKDETTEVESVDEIEKLLNS